MYVVPATVATWAKPVHPLPWQRSTRYPVTPLLVEALHARLIRLLPTAVGLGLARQGGVFLDIDPTPVKFLRSVFNRRLKPVICMARADILDGLAAAAGAGKLRLPVAEIAPLKDAIALLTALENGRKIGGKALVGML